MLVFAERHCAQCLTQTHTGVTTYYHPILEAKGVTAGGVVLSLMTEFTPHLRWVQVLKTPANTPPNKIAN